MGADALEASQHPLSGQPETIRAFLGVGLPRAQREALSGYLDDRRATEEGLRWVSTANLHLTLRFLGAVTPELVASLTEDLRGGLRFSPFEVRVGATGRFGRGRAVRVLWLGVDAGAAELAGLAGQVEEACGRSGLAPEARPYHPHLTLARARDRLGVELPELPPVPAVPGWQVEEITLFRSRLTTGGAVYSVLERFGA